MITSRSTSLNVFGIQENEQVFNLKKKVKKLMSATLRVFYAISLRDIGINKTFEKFKKKTNL